MAYEISSAHGITVKCWVRDNERTMFRESYLQRKLVAYTPREQLGPTEKEWGFYGDEPPPHEHLPDVSRQHNVPQGK